MYVITYTDENTDEPVLCSSATGRVIFASKEEALNVVHSYLKFYHPNQKYYVLSASGHVQETIL